MKGIKKIAGKLLYAITNIISTVFDIIIAIVSFSVNVTRAIAGGFAALVGMGGCLLFFMFAGPFGLYFLLNPIILFPLLFLMIFPILGTKFVSFLKYIQYMVTEYLFDRANYLIYGTNSKYASFSEYGNKYRREQEARRKREQQRKQEEIWRQWEERFRMWQEYQNSQRNYGDYSYSGYGNYTGYEKYTYNNPTLEFKKKYEESCDILGVPYNADKYQIKLAYRKKAKEYHPDLNQSPNATEMFQKINSAYEFLSDNNMERYNKMN